MNASPHTAISIQSLNSLEHFERCVVLQLEVWGYSDGDVIPRRVFVVAQRIGGQVLGAFDGETLVGFAMSLPGYRDGKSYLHSHMLAVLPQYRNAGIGRRLKARPARRRHRSRHRSDGVDLRSPRDQELASQHQPARRDRSALSGRLLRALLLPAAGWPAHRQALRGVVAALPPRR
ncbi:GNAT family N-acetyltransferase [Tunturiibacter empetritectus]|uniref:GNAT family N-acetyltransferase n=1 Tax=Tunturiibacter empetritectus TaxID=3069691 RepID=UPI003D9B104A